MKMLAHRLLVTLAMIVSINVLAPTQGMAQDLCSREFSIFTENMRTKTYEYAIPSFRYLLDNCLTPGTGLYIRGEELMEHYIKKSKDPKVKDGYVDTLLILLDRRLEASKIEEKYGREGFILGKKAIALATYRKDSVQVIYDLAKKAVTLEKQDAWAVVMSIYMQYTAELKIANTLNCDDVIQVYNELSGYIDEGLEKYDTDTIKVKNFNKAQENLDKLAGPCLTCDNLVDIFSKNFDTYKDDAVWVKKAADALDRKKCAKDEKVKDNPIIFKIFERNVQLNPTSDGYLKLARMQFLEKECGKAAENYEKAAELATDNTKKANIYMELASVQADCGNYSAARTAARKAADLRKNWGKPYIFIGDLYAGSSGKCAGDDNISSRSVFWAAVDKYSYAKSIDPSCVDEANRKIGISAANYPELNDLFFSGKKEGESYTVGCWIQEGTTIRAKK